MAGRHGATRLMAGFRLRRSSSASKMQRIHSRSPDKCRERVDTEVLNIIPDMARRAAARPDGFMQIRPTLPPVNVS